jgi:hypothetical protein
LYLRDEDRARLAQPSLARFSLTFAAFVRFNARIRFADIAETSSADRAASRLSASSRKVPCGFRIR